MDNLDKIISYIQDYGLDAAKSKYSNLLYIIIGGINYSIGSYDNNFAEYLFDIIKELIEDDRDFYKNDKKLYYLLIDNFNSDNIFCIFQENLNNFDTDFITDEDDINNCIDEIDELNNNIINFKKRIINLLFD